jgi:mannosyl-oligosaccharide alpha-1,2-mannosidase
LETSAQSSESTLLAEIGSLGLEFTHLSQLTSEPKYFDAVQRMADNLQSMQNLTRLPGLWPVSLDAHALRFTGSYFAAGGMADSAYECLVKEYLPLGAQSNQYLAMYVAAMEGIKKHLLFQGMNKAGEDIFYLWVKVMFACPLH